MPLVMLPIVLCTCVKVLVCIMYCALYFSISQDKLTGLIKWYRQHGLLPKKCRSGGRLYNKHALSFEDVTQVVHFITNYAEANALTLPGRVPGFKRSDIKLLPSSDTKASLWRTYQTIMKDAGNYHKILFIAHYVLSECTIKS